MTIVTKRKKSEKAKKEATVDRRNEKDTIQREKKTKTGRKMIEAVSSFQTKVIFFLRDSIQNLFAVQPTRSCVKNIL